MDTESREELVHELKKTKEILEDNLKERRRIHRLNSESVVDQSKEVKRLRQLFFESK